MVEVLIWVVKANRKPRSTNGAASGFGELHRCAAQPAIIRSGVSGGPGPLARTSPVSPLVGERGYGKGRRRPQPFAFSGVTRALAICLARSPVRESLTRGPLVLALL